MLPEKEKHYTFHSQQKMKRTTCCCGSVRLWIVVLIAATALGLVVLSGWPSSLYYGNKADSAVKLQEDFDKAVEHKSHLHKHYHRQSPNTHSSNELNEVQSNIVVNNQPDKHPAGTEKSVTEVTEEEETEIKDPKLRAYKEKILTAQDEALQVLESKSGWTHEQGEHKEAEGVVFSKATKWGKVFKLEAILEVKADLLFEDIVYQSEKVPEWNPTMLKVQVLKSIDDSTEISYSLSASAASGMISSRDFVYLRHWEEEDGWLVTSSISVYYPNAPDGSQYVRGEQKPGIMRMRAVPGGKAELQWLLNSDVKGWVPTSIVNQALAGTLVDYLKSLRAHAAHLG